MFTDEVEDEVAEQAASEVIVEPSAEQQAEEPAGEAGTGVEEKQPEGEARVNEESRLAEEPVEPAIQPSKQDLLNALPAVPTTNPIIEVCSEQTEDRVAEEE